jgi:hypothetical protein
VTGAASSPWQLGVHGDSASAEVYGAAVDAVRDVSESNGSQQCSEARSSLCVVCRVGLRDVGLVHGDEMCLCLCKGCAAAYGCGSACPMCGQLVQEQLEI